MKRILLALVCSAGTLLYADADLREKNFAKPESGTSEIVSVGWMDHGLKLNAASEADAEVLYNQAFNFRAGFFYEINGDFSVQGEIFVKLYFFNQDGTPYKVPEKSAAVRQKRDEFEAKFDLREFTNADSSYQFKAAIGVKKGGSVILDDLELEVDDD